MGGHRNWYNDPIFGNFIMKILIITPEIHRLVGVANHYLGLSPYWTEHVSYLFYGKRSDKTPTWLTILLYPYDYFRFIWSSIRGKYDVVIINPSLRKAQVIRDGLFLLLTRAFGRPAVTFIHGFDTDYAARLAEKGKLFRWCYNKSAFIYTLYSGFRNQLQRIGITCPIVLTTTKVADEMLAGVTIPARKNIINILFVARIVKEKGIFITLRAYEELQPKYPQLRLTVCGDGPALADAKKYTADRKIKNVIFKGNITGNKLRDMYLDADLYILPTYQEGMATSVLEAMAFGLPVLSRPVGGVRDFWKNKDMGFLMESLDSHDYAQQIEQLIGDSSLVEHISTFNRQYARDHFLASKVTEKFEDDIKKFLTV